MPRTGSRSLALACVVGAGAACSSSVAPAHDASDRGTVVDAVDAPVDAADIPRVNTCSELHLDAVTAMPGHAGLAYPGSRLALQGAGFDAVLHVVVGGVEMPFDRTSDSAITTTVPPMLATGDRIVSVQTERCMSAAPIALSRLLAVVRSSTSQVMFVDATDLSVQGALDLATSTVQQAVFSFDGAHLLTRDASGTVRRTSLPASTTAPISMTSNGPFAFVQGTIDPTRGLLDIPGGAPPGLALVDTASDTSTPYPSPAVDPISLALSLDGFRALVLDRGGMLYRGDLPFAPAAAWSPVSTWTPRPDASRVIMAQAPNGPAEHLACIFVDAPSPTLFPMNAIDGTVGAPIALPPGASQARFLSGDVVVMDTITPEVLAFDITGLEPTPWTVPLRGEPAGAEVATRTAITLYRLGALVLRRGSDGVARADTLHVLDFMVEPPVESGLTTIPDMRGVVGMQGSGNPFVVWTAHTLVRVLGDDPSPAQQHTMDLGPGGDITLVAVQP